MFSLLLKHGVAMTSDGSEDLAVCLEAVKAGDVGVMRYLLERREFCIESNTGYNGSRFQGLTPLSRAAIAGHKDMAEFLLERGANIEARDSHGVTPLSWAARTYNATVVDILLEHNACLESRNNQGETALLEAIHWQKRPNDTSHANEAVVEVLLNHDADTEVKDKDNMTPLLWAVKTHWVGAIKKLLDRGVRTDCKDQDGRTAWQLAEYLGEKSVIVEFLKRRNETNVEPNWSRTLLSEATFARVQSPLWGTIAIG